jgi:hypothetical protein
MTTAHLTHLPESQTGANTVQGQPLPYIQAGLNYLVENNGRSVNYQYQPPVGVPKRSGRFDLHTVPIHDARPLVAELSLDRHGFELHRHLSAVSDFYDTDQIRNVYYPEIETLVKNVSGASRVVIFDHTLRADSQDKRDEKSVREPATIVHNDYTERSGPQRVRDLLDSDDAQSALKGRFAVINVWRPINGPVQSAPIALADAQSVAHEDLIETDLIYPDRVGEIYQAAFNPQHRWFYFPDMRPDEALFIKGYDSLKDGRAQYTIHSAFEDPTSGPKALPRESIELRTLAFFDHE